MAAGKPISHHTAPVYQTSKQYCPQCQANVYWRAGAATGKARCSICGAYTSPIQAVGTGSSINSTPQHYNYSNDPPTEPMIPVAKKVQQEEDVLDLVYCEKCGNHYSHGKCDSGHEQRYVKRA